ncbi:bifunctional metallophosphatase/5'-nucleotidase [Streptomyces sp. NPDC049040]|uniref:bifunctional metallophosphatase/5'-nucleotidase n=1 Tax=Streptomyces sp. NPDC049040 TaxID=3365593 RepID=UPI0037113BA8
MTRLLKRIIATTDFHSALGEAGPMLSCLCAARSDTLIMDSGDFFEGTGYYRLGGGALELATLLALYDVVAPGNHGWRHYFEPDLHRITVCANAYEAGGRRLFRPVDFRRIGGRTTAVTGVLGFQAFNAIPYAQCVGQRVVDPAQALRELQLAHEEVDSWIVLSHSGFEEDLRLARTCPFIDVIFAGHCHGSQYGPVHVGNTTVLKGYELGAGYACAEPSDRGWAAQVSRFPDTGPSHLSDELEPLRARIRAAGRQLSVALGPVSAPYRHSALDRRALLTDVVNRLRVEAQAPTDAVLLNETALRTATLSGTLTRGDLLAVEPFDNHLVRATVPEHFQDNPDSLAAHITAYAGPIVTAPVPLPPRPRTILTTGYLADVLAAPAETAGIPLAQAVRHALTDGTSLDPHRP